MRLSTRQVSLLVVALSTVGAVPAAVRAEFIVSAETVTVAPGSTGFVQILLMNAFATSETLSSFSVDMALGGTGVQFTGVDDQTNPAYVFDGFGTGTLTFDTFPNAGFILSDVSLNADGFVTLSAGQTVGLGRIAFEVDNNAAQGLRPITFTRGPTTLFTDAANNVYADSDVSLQSGGINVQGSASAVPEPTTATLLVIGSGCGLFVAWRKKQKGTAYVHDR